MREGEEREKERYTERDFQTYFLVFCLFCLRKGKLRLALKPRMPLNFAASALPPEYRGASFTGLRMDSRQAPCPLCCTLSYSDLSWVFIKSAAVGWTTEPSGCGLVDH